MQNRFVLSGVPRRARRFGDALLRVVEDDVCFVDRWAWLDDGCVIFELSLENTRDVAVKSFDRRELVLGDDAENDCHGVLCFEVRSAPASQSQSAELLEKCPANGKVVNSPSSGDAPDTQGVQTLTFSLSEGHQSTDAGEQNADAEGSRVTLRFQTTTEGGTGATAWRGGLLLAEQILLWHSTPAPSPSDALDHVRACFHGTDVLELGAGAVALPSMVLGTVGGPRSITASDSIDEILAACSVNLQLNDCLAGRVTVRRIDWADFARSTTDTRARAAVCHSDVQEQFDTILFSDCVYSDAGARMLSACIARLLRPGGTVVGVASSMRVGERLFRRQLAACGFHALDLSPTLRHSQDAKSIALTAAQSSGAFRVAGGSSQGYTLTAWRRGPWPVPTPQTLPSLKSIDFSHLKSEVASTSSTLQGSSQLPTQPKSRAD